jgi:hypothetical protein
MHKIEGTEERRCLLHFSSMPSSLWLLDAYLELGAEHERQVGIAKSGEM